MESGGEAQSIVRGPEASRSGPPIPGFADLRSRRLCASGPSAFSPPRSGLSTKLIFVQPDMSNEATSMHPMVGGLIYGGGFG